MKILITALVTILSLAPANLAAQTSEQRAHLAELSATKGNPWAQAGAATRGAKDAAIYRSASPSVVLLVTDDSIGSGSLVSTSGQIITNWHVIAGYRNVAVVFKPKTEGAEPTREDLRLGQVVKYDEVADLALIQATDTPSGKTPLRLGDTSDINIGADVHAIGHPTGQAWTYTTGIISQYRKGYDWLYKDDRIKHSADIIQVQTPINPGNSGGPLIGDSGALIGVVTFKGAGEGINFAVSVEDVKKFLARSGNRSGEIRQADASQSDSAQPSIRISDIRFGEITAPYPLTDPGVRSIVLSNTSQSAIHLVTIGALARPTPNKKCPSDIKNYDVSKTFRVYIEPMDSSTVTGEFTTNSRYFCILRVG